MTDLPGTRLLMTTDAVGGVWTFSIGLARALRERGVQVMLVSMGPPPSQQQRAMLAGHEGIALHETDLQLEWQDPAGADVAHAEAVLRKIVVKFRPDLIHFNGYREAAMGWSVPTLVVAHSCVNSWMEACGEAEAFSDRAWTAYTANVADGLACADAWAAPTVAFRDWIARRYGCASRGAAIWNGIDDQAGSDVPRQLVVLAAGRVWDAAKNLAVLGPVAADLGWPIRIAGAADVNGRRPRATIASCEVLGALSFGEMRREMQRASIFVSPALYEPFGLSVLEAARAGCALVLSDLPSFRELWDGTALFVDPRDAAAIRRALLKLCTDAPLLRRMQRLSVERSRRYALRDTADCYSALYASLLDRKAPRKSSAHGARISA
jgi:glycosyltransferase involved in cell wall biosynthesis